VWGEGGAQETGVHFAPELSRPATRQVVGTTIERFSADAL